jgi:hypothetical protein
VRKRRRKALNTMLGGGWSQRDTDIVPIWRCCRPVASMDCVMLTNSGYVRTKLFQIVYIFFAISECNLQSFVKLFVMYSKDVLNN